MKPFMLEEILPLDRPLVIFDTETTGTNPRTDRIVEIACVKIHPDGRRETWEKRLNRGSDTPVPRRSTGFRRGRRARPSRRSLRA
jgi:DNA polymerase III epsilon subunit-like protein